MNKQGWAIIGEHGIYTGWWLTRRDAIAGHVSDLYFNVSQFPTPTGLDEKQKKYWKKCRERGDRAVKVMIEIL